MDEKQREVKQKFTRQQLEKMSVDDLIALIGEAGPNATFRGTAVVRKADGSIRYDENAEPGTYHEAPEDLPETVRQNDDKK